VLTDMAGGSGYEVHCNAFFVFFYSTAVLILILLLASVFIM